MKKITTLLLLCVSTLLYSQTKPCSIYGSAKNHSDSIANSQKNRTIKIKKVKNKISLNDLLNDSGVLSPDSFVCITGYVVEIKKGGTESCNCGATDDSLQDIHLYIGPTPNTQKEECIIVEITPRFKKLNPKFDIKQFTGNKVNVYGYLFYDKEHRGNAKNTCVICTNVWRRTVWEIHPVVKIELTK